MGQRLRLDLENRSVKIEKLSLDYCRKWLGGRGFNAEVIQRETMSALAPFEPADLLCIAAGPLTGTFSPLAGNLAVGARCPTAGAVIGQDLFFGAALKYAGYDQLVVRGKAAAPSYLFIDNDRVEFREADRLRGLTPRQAAKKIAQESMDTDIKVVLLDADHLQAIAVKGTKPVRIAFPDRLAGLSWQLHDRMQHLLPDAEQKGEPTGGFLNDISCWCCPSGCGRSRGAGDVKENMPLRKEMCIADILGVCRRAVSAREAVGSWQETYFELFRQATGIDFGDDEILAAVDRIMGIEREYEAKERRR